MLKRQATQRAIALLEIASLSVPLFQKVQKTPAGGFTLRLKLSAGTSIKDLEKITERFAVALKVDTVKFTKTSANGVLLTAQKGLPKNLPKMPTQSSNQMLLFPTSPNKVSIGIDADGSKVDLELFNSAGGTVTLIGGNPGKGKSSLLKIMVAGLMESNHAIIWFDAKSGADARPFQHRADVFDDPASPEMFLEVLNKIQDLTRRRNQFNGRGWDIAPLSKMVLIIDEWAILAGLGSKQLQTSIQQELRKIVATARSANISVVLATQRPTKDNIDITTRELSNTRISFQVGDIHASEAILGFSGAEPSVNNLPRGRALKWENGDITKFALFDISQTLPNPVTTNGGLKLTVDDLLLQADTFEREHLKYGPTP
jgi:hypothetical protein